MGWRLVLLRGVETALVVARLEFATGTGRSIVLAIFGFGALLEAEFLCAAGVNAGQPTGAVCFTGISAIAIAETGGFS